MVNIFEYFDYRNFLKDYYEFRKKENPIFSHRYLGMKVGISPSTFNKVIQKKRNLSLRLAVKLAEELKFKKREKEYFQLLVLFDQSENHDERNQYFQKLMNFRTPKFKDLEEKQYQYFENWYHVAIRELLSFYDFKENYEALGKMLAPNIKPTEAKKALHNLVDLKLIKKNKKGFYKPTSQNLSTGKEWNSLAITNFQLATSDLASEAINRFPRPSIDFSTMTLKISSKNLRSFKEKFAIFRSELAKEEASAEDTDSVYQINFQMFPLTKLPK